ncbi:MAG: Na+/H+ antiporter NhaC family protein, partial [Bacteroidaceae bacterium]|nr:Na+/H+ antiporter NhaC family protein [Bacteroidaceae bacterium]
IDYIIRSLTKRVSTGRGAEWSIAALVSITNLCTANNTVAILSVGKLSRDIAEKYGVDKRKSASVLDTFSCFVQSLIPYGAQLLMAAGLAAISPVEIIPFLFYPFIMGVCAMLAIQFRYPGKYSSI